MPNKFNNIERLIEIIAKLRSPEGCPWDREQTHKSLRKNFLEETYEAIDAIDSGDDTDLKEELGDVLLQIVLHAQIADEENKFNVDDVAKTIADKLVRRHPHVFADVKVKDIDEIWENWEAIKKKEKPERKSALSGLTNSQPALMTAAQISKKAVKVGFEWPSIESLWECIESEIEEFKEEEKTQNHDRLEDELGDILFSVVNLARWHKIDPELALIRANKKFISRFEKMEELANGNLKNHSFDEYDKLWKNAKKELAKIEKQD